MAEQPRVAHYNLVIPSVGREISDQNWETVEPAHIRVLEDLKKRYKRYVVNFDSREFVLGFDLQPIIDIQKDYLSRQKHFESSRDFRIFEGLDRRASVAISVESSAEKQEAFENVSTYILEYLLFEMFAAANIASPGSLNFLGAHLVKNPPRTTLRGNDIHHIINLNSYLPEDCLYQKASTPWLRVQSLPVADAFDWLKTACPRFHMIADNPAARCVYAIYYLCRFEEHDPSAVIWLFYALESLYDCRVGENQRALVARISLLLQLSEKERDRLKRSLRELYDYRSAFVHGNLAIVHPLKNEVLDKRVDTEWSRLMDLISFGVTILFVSLQRLVHQGWDFPRFRERLEN